MTEGCLNCPAGTARLQLQHQHFEVTLGGPHAANTGCQEGGQRERERQTGAVGGEDVCIVSSGVIFNATWIQYGFGPMCHVNAP